MKKAFDFISSLSESTLDLLGYPTVKMHSDCCAVVFKVYSTIRTLSVFENNADELRLYSEDGAIMVVFTFYE